MRLLEIASGCCEVFPSGQMTRTHFAFVPSLKPNDNLAVDCGSLSIFPGEEAPIESPPLKEPDDNARVAARKVQMEARIVFSIHVLLMYKIVMAKSLALN